MNTLQHILSGIAVASTLYSGCVQIDQIQQPYFGKISTITPDAKRAEVTYYKHPASTKSSDMIFSTEYAHEHNQVLNRCQGTADVVCKQWTIVKVSTTNKGKYQLLKECKLENNVVECYEGSANREEMDTATRFQQDMYAQSKLDQKIKNEQLGSLSELRRIREMERNRGQ